MWTHAELASKNRTGTHVDVERVNANERRLTYDRDAPRRMVIIGSRGGARYAIKFAPAWHVRIVREIQVLRTLNSGKEPFPRGSVVELLGHGGATLPPSASMQGTHATLPARVGGRVARIRIPIARARSVARLFERKARARGLQTTGGIRMRYFATRVHPGYDEWSKYAPSLRRRPVAFRRAIEEKAAVALGSALLRAHVAHGFAHVDLHPSNMLMRVTYRPKEGAPRDVRTFADVPATATPGQVNVRCRLFDFDLAYLPRKPSLPTDSPYRGAWDDADLDLWLYASMQQPNASKRSVLAPYTIVHDIARVCYFFLREADAATMRRVAKAWAKAIGRGEARVAELLDYACSVAKNYGFHEYYRAFLERAEQGLSAPKVR